MIDVAVGLDGLVYALNPDGSPSGTRIFVYDPISMVLQRTIEMLTQNRAIAVNAAGHIFTVGGIESIRHYDPNGIQIGATLSDIDVDRDGNLLIASHGGMIAVTTEALQSLTAFNTRTSNGMNFPTCVPPANALSVNIMGTSISENGGTIRATVSRNTDITNALTVTLSSSDTNKATVPATVTIALGQSTSARFAMAGFDDTIADGTKTVTLSASVAAHEFGTDTVDVTDDARFLRNPATWMVMAILMPTIPF